MGIGEVERGHRAALPGPARTVRTVWRLEPLPCCQRRAAFSAIGVYDPYSSPSNARYSLEQGSGKGWHRTLSETPGQLRLSRPRSRPGKKGSCASSRAGPYIPAWPDSTGCAHFHPRNSCPLTATRSWTSESLPRGIAGFAGYRETFPG